MDFANLLRGAFQREEVPMAATPSIVKLGEGESIQVAPDARRTHGPEGVFGDPYGGAVPPMTGPYPQDPYGGAMPPPQGTEGVVSPQQVMDQHREDYAFPNPMVMAQEMADKSMVPVMDDPGIPPELNETVKDTIENTGVPAPEGYNEAVKRRQESMQGDPNRKHPRSVYPGGLKDIGAGEESELTPEEATEVDEAVSTLPAAPLPDSAPGTQEPPQRFRDREGNDTPVTREQVEQVAAEDPSGFSKAMSWIKKTLGVSGQDLARFATLYAGSRLAGYDHQGSMSWSFEVAGEDLVRRRTMHATMANTGKYTPASLEKFRKTGDFSTLKAAADGKGTQINYTAPKFASDGSTVVYPAKLANGTQVHVTKDGQTYTGFVTDPEDEDSNKELYEKYEGRVAAIGAEMTKSPSGKNAPPPWYTGSTTADAAIATEFALDFALENGIPPDSAAFGNITRGAYEQARRWAQATGNQVNSIQPFLDQQKVYVTSDQAWAGALKDRNGQKLDIEKFGQLSNSIMQQLSESPQFAEVAKNADQGTMISWAMKALHDDFVALPADQRKSYENKGGFYAYLQEATLNPYDN